MTSNLVARVRRFQRAVTSEIGLLDASFLGRGRPLGVARVLNAIGGGKTDVSEIRTYLALDSGLLSRLLRSLEAEGLIVVEKEPTDARRRNVTLTEAGLAEYQAYEALADKQAADLLAKHDAPGRLLAAMDLVASTLARDRITIDVVDPRDARAKTSMSAYYAELAQRLDQGFDVALSRDPDVEDMLPQRGAFLIAVSDGLTLGCVGLKGTDKGFAEVKRLWVSPAARGIGLSRRLMADLERIAVDLGISVLRLDTNTALSEAVALYRKTGWTEISRYNDDPYPDLFFEKHLPPKVA